VPEPSLNVLSPASVPMRERLSRAWCLEGKDVNNTRPCPTVRREGGAGPAVFDAPTDLSERKAVILGAVAGDRAFLAANSFEEEEVCDF